MSILSGEDQNARERLFRKARRYIYEQFIKTVKEESMKTVSTVFIKFVLTSLLLTISSFTNALLIHTSDFIANDDRDYFNGFEGLPDSPTTTMDYSYTENNIKVEQVVNPNNHDQFPQIWIAGVPDGPEGSNAWYPNSGDYGYTMITMEDGSDFNEIGLLVGSGSPKTKSVMFELYNDGDIVTSGNVDFLFDFQYLGFSDEIFDTLLLRDAIKNPDNISFLDSNLNTLSIDSIEVRSVPEPPTLFLFGAGLIAIYIQRKI